jgi:hypothetical protein
MVNAMRSPKAILGGILALALTVVTALPALSEAVEPPDLTLRLTAPILPVASPGGAPLAPWTGERPAARPAHMLRYPVIVQTGAAVRPVARDAWLPAMRWDDRAGAADWTRTAMAAVQSAGMTDVIPDDIATWCPAYIGNDDRHRAAFWVGVLSSLARYESGHNPGAVGGGGLYYGLLQILPSTARQYGCEARSGEALRDAELNLECAVLISAENVIRDDAVARDGDRNAGLARDWGPMTVDSRAADMAAWTREQDYCTLPTGVLSAPLPPARPWTLAATTATPSADVIDLAMLGHDIRELRAIPAPRS